MIVLIISSIVVYITIGLLLTGFMEINNWDNLIEFLVIVLLWPAFIAILVVSAICAVPVRLGKKIGNKYRKPVEHFLDKIFND